MNFHHIQAIRQLNAQRDFHAAMMLTGGAGAHNDANDSIAMIDAQLSQRVQSEYREQEAVLDAYLRKGADGLNAAQTTVFRNAMSTTSGSQGGYLVPAPVAVAVADALKQYSSVRRASTVLTTATGANMTWPNSDGRAEVGEQMNQNQAATGADPTFGTAAMNTFKYGSKIITVPFELVQDTSIDFVAYLVGRVAARIGRITNTKLTTGAGTTEPLGVQTAAGVGKAGLTGQTATVIYDDLADLMGSVDPAYRESAKCAWMMNDATLTYIRKMKDAQGLPLNLVVPGIRALGEPDSIFGFPVVTNPDMPTMAANAKSILFGDFSTFIVRDVPQTQITRFDDSAYITKGQYGYLGITRTGGAYVDVGNSIRAYQNSAA